MVPVILKCPSWLFGVLIAGASGLLAIIPVITELGLPPITEWSMLGVAVVIATYALTLIPAKLVLSDEGLCQNQLFSELNLQWKEIAEWRYERGYDGEVFWIRDKAGKRRYLKGWLVCGKNRSKRVAEVLRQKGVVGCWEEKDG